MLRITSITAVDASRRAFLAGLQPQCSRPQSSKGYSTGETSFSIHVPRANKQNRNSKSSASKQHFDRTRHQGDRTRRSNVIQPSPPSRRTFSYPTRTKRILALSTPQLPVPASTETKNSQLIVLQKAIDGQNITAVSSAWQQVGQGIERLSISDHHKLFCLCSSHSSSTHNEQKAQSWRSCFVDFAKAASLTGDVNLISGWFQLLLENGQAENVIQIWETIVQMRLENGSNRTFCQDDYSESSPTAETTGNKFVRLDVSSNGDIIDIHDMICLVVFACAHSRRASDFAERFEKLEIGSPFRLFFNMSRAKRLYDTISISASSNFIRWDSMQSLLWEFELARGLSSGSVGPQRIARLLGSLCQLHKVEEAYTIFITPMRAAAEPNAWLSLQVPHERSSLPPSSRAQWTESCWSVCLSNFIAAGRTDLAKEVWTKFQQRGFQPTSHIWNSLLDGYARAKNYKAAVQTWETAVKQANQHPSTTMKVPDELMYTTMINIYFQAKEPDQAMALLSEMMINSDRRGGSLTIQAETFNAALHGLFFNRMQTQAQSLLDQMLTKGPAPNIGTINTLLRAYARAGDLEPIVSTLRLADKLELKPDVVTFTTILDALLRKGGESATAAVIRTLDIMKSMGVQPNVVTYTAMIKACLVGAEAAQLDLASQGLLGDSTDQKRQPRTRDEVRIEAALELLDRMVKAKVAPSEITYTALIGGCLHDPYAVAHAFGSDALPRHYRSPPKPLHRLGENAETVQRWLRDTPQVSLSLLLLEQMKGRGLPPTTTTFHYLIEGLCSPHTDQAAFVRAMDLIDDMLLRVPVSDPTRKLGPFASSVIRGEGVLPPTLHAPTYKAWIIIFSSLLDRLENGPRDKLATTTGARALSTAIRLVREMGSLSGTDGGMSLSRYVERAASLASKLAR